MPAKPPSAAVSANAEAQMQEYLLKRAKNASGMDGVDGRVSALEDWAGVATTMMTGTQTTCAELQAKVNAIDDILRARELTT